MKEEFDFVLRCLENVTDEQIVVSVMTIIGSIAAHFGLKLGRKTVLGVCGLALTALRVAGWVFKNPEDSEAAKAMMEALDDDAAVYEKGVLTCTGVVVTFLTDNDGAPTAVQTAYAQGGAPYLKALLSEREWSRFCAKAKGKGEAVVARDRAEANRAAAAVIRKKATIEQVGRLNLNNHKAKA